MTMFRQKFFAKRTKRRLDLNFRIVKPASSQFSSIPTGTDNRRIKGLFIFLLGFFTKLNRSYLFIRDYTPIEHGNIHGRAVSRFQAQFEPRKWPSKNFRFKNRNDKHSALRHPSEISLADLCQQTSIFLLTSFTFFAQIAKKKVFRISN